MAASELGVRGMSMAGTVPMTVLVPNAGALALLPGRGQTHADYLRGFASCMEARGVRPRKLLEAFGLEGLALDEAREHLSCQTVVKLLERSSRETNDSLLGLRLAQAQEPDVLGCAIPLARAAPNFGSAIDQLIRYLPFTHSQEANMELLVGRQAAELRWYSPVELEYCEQAYYHHLIIVHKLLSRLTGGSFRARRATLRCGVRAPDLGTLSEALACPLEAQAGGNSIAFDRALLQQPLQTANGVAFAILHNALEGMMRAASEGDIQRVRAYVQATLATGRCTIEDCASRLGTSSRTLQKRLTEQKTTFSQLVEQIKIETAAQSLTIRSRPISEIALDLGYSEHSCFTRAFKRWTGQTPEEFRSRAAAKSVQ